jgi:hypothetical protein
LAAMSKNKIPEVHELLERHGPSTSSFIVQKLVEAGVTQAAARQRVSRAKDPVRRLDRIRFPHGHWYLHKIPEAQVVSGKSVKF